MVARVVRDDEAAGSNPVTPTQVERNGQAPFALDLLLSWELALVHFRGQGRGWRDVVPEHPDADREKWVLLPSSDLLRFRD